MTLDPTAPLPDLLAALVDIESVSGHERRLADEVERALGGYRHLELTRSGNTLVARTDLGRAERVVVAGHLDTVPVADNLPSRRTVRAGADVVWGRGSCDMKGGVAVQLALAAELTAPGRDVTWLFYDNEEVEADRNGLNRLAAERPDLLAGDFAVLGEPTGAVIEGGCQGTMRVEVRLTGTAAHSARSWLGHNAIHDAGDVLGRLTDYRPRTVTVDGLEYREGLNAVRIAGGVAGNVIPDRCVVEVNFRFAPDRGVADAESHLREVFAGFDIDVTDAAPAARPGLDRPIAADFLAACGGHARAKFGWTDVARFAELGIPAVNFGPGDPGLAHADDECCAVADLAVCADALRAWLSRGSGPGRG